MTFADFQNLTSAHVAAAPWLFEAARDAPLTPTALDQIEQDKGIRLPPSYRMFLSTYGAGSFGTTDIYSPDPASGWSLWNDVDGFLSDRDVLPFADNGGGDYLAFPIKDGQCEDRVIWADHEQDYAISESEYADFLDYLVKDGLRTN